MRIEHVTELLWQHIASLGWPILHRFFKIRRNVELLQAIRLHICSKLFIVLKDVVIPLIDWISDTHCQGCTDLQSLVKCLDHREIVIRYAVRILVVVSSAL